MHPVCCLLPMISITPPLARYRSTHPTLSYHWVTIGSTACLAAGGGCKGFPGRAAEGSPGGGGQLPKHPTGPQKLRDRPAAALVLVSAPGQLAGAHQQLIVPQAQMPVQFSGCVRQHGEYSGPCSDSAWHNSCCVEAPAPPQHLLCRGSRRLRLKGCWLGGCMLLVVVLLSTCQGRLRTCSVYPRLW